MRNLKEIQSDFIDGVYDNNHKILDIVKAKKAPKERFLGIYQNNLYGVLTDALRLTYPDVFKFLQEEKFNEIAKDFIKKHRSKSGNLDEYGEEFYEFVKSEENGDFLHDLAKINWLKQDSYLAEDEDDFDVLALQKLEPEKLFDVKFKLSKNCFLHESDYNLFAKTNRDKKRKNKSYYVIFRHFLEIKVEKINKKEFGFLTGVKRNLTLFKIYEEYACDIEKSIQKYINSGILKSFSI